MEGQALEAAHLPSHYVQFKWRVKTRSVENGVRCDLGVYSASLGKGVGGIGVTGMLHVEPQESQVGVGDSAQVNVHLVQVTLNLGWIAGMPGEVDEIVENLKRTNCVLDDAAGIAAHRSQAKRLRVLLALLPGLGFNRDGIHRFAPGLYTEEYSCSDDHERRKVLRQVPQKEEPSGSCRTVPVAGVKATIRSEGIR